MELGFIGLGIMGKPMAKNLIRAGHRLWVHNRSPKAVEDLVAAGAQRCESPAAVAERCDIIFTMLPDSPDLAAVVLGEGTDVAPLVEKLKSGSLLVDLSSVAPATSRRVGDRLRERGVAMLDAPVSGGETGAIEATLTVMVGGSESDFDRARPLLSSMGRTVVLVGPLGSGNTAKLANQLVVAANIAAVSEALILAANNGVDPEKVYQAIRGGLAGSAVMDAKVPKMLQRDFAPGFRLELHMKDMLNVLATAQDSGCSLPLTAVVGSLLRAAMNNGQQNEDHGALVKVMESLNQVCVKPQSTREKQPEQA